MYENHEALSLFLLAGPDCSRCVKEFEAVINTPGKSAAHHEEDRSMQVRYRNDVLSLIEIVEQLGNPFAEGHELVVLDAREVMEQEVVTSLFQVHEVGKDLHARYVCETLDQRIVPITNTLRRNKVFTFANRPVQDKRGNQSSGVHRQNMTLVMKLFLSLQSRPDANMEEFFHFENQREPPSLADRGSLRSGNKSDILECIKAPNCRAAFAKKTTVVVLDMAAVVHIVRPTSAKTFAEYVTQNVVPFLKSQITPTTSRIDAI